MEWTDQDRVKEFNSTRKCSTYNSILDTRIYSEGYLHNLKLNRHGCTVTVKTYSDTVQEILESSKSEYVAALNFADGYMPGGLVLYGAATQEEDLGIAEVYRYLDRIKIHKNNMYFDIYNQENKVLIKDKYDKDVLNITLSFCNNGHLDEGQCREDLLVAIKSL